MEGVFLCQESGLGMSTPGVVSDLVGAPEWIRTIDLPLRRRLLYPLSYEGGGDRV